MARRGIKICPKCSTENGVRTFVCKCGHNFFPGQKRKTVTPTPKPASERKKGRGIKQCPDCEALCGARTLKCECGFDFTSVVKTVAPKSKKDPVLKVPQKTELKFTIPPYQPPKRLSPKEHAKRILSYGKKRAALLLQFARIQRSWSHVDWDLVELGLQLGRAE
jgi:hypothetical protein